MERVTHRIETDAALGRARRGQDIALGALALLPLFGGAALSFASGAVAGIIPGTLTVIWASALLAFFAGVRRGLSFSEAGGASAGEIATMLALFAVAIISMLFCSPVLAALGLIMVGMLDTLAARRGEAPAYFTTFRPIQMGLGAMAMLVVQVRAG